MSTRTTFAIKTKFFVEFQQLRKLRNKLSETLKNKLLKAIKSKVLDFSLS